MMQTRTYVVYDSESGDVVQLHVEPADLATDPNELVRMADPAGERHLKVLEGHPSKLLGRATKVVEGKLKQADEEGPAASAGVHSGFEEPHASRDYRPHR